MINCKRFQINKTLHLHEQMSVSPWLVFQRSRSLVARIFQAGRPSGFGGGLQNASEAAIDESGILGTVK